MGAILLIVCGLAIFLSLPPDTLGELLGIVIYVSGIVVLGVGGPDRSADYWHEKRLQAFLATAGTPLRNRSSGRPGAVDDMGS